ncbi:MAG TPA: hypothetical protein EYP10_00410, partial [Armatimonadetes bacterium]|nr:hypothetical protein [Armatimonadota bacterium]
RRTFALRACRFMFGDEIGHLIAPAYAENISHTFICFPEQVMRHIKIDDPVQTMREQAQATARALESLERAWKLQRRTNVLKGDRYGYFLNMYLMTHAGHILAMHRTYIMAARRAIQRGDRVEAERQLNAARAFLKKAEGQWAKARARAPLKHLFAIPYRRTVPPGYLTWLNIAELRNEVEELWRRRDALIAAYTIPRWFEEICRRRELIAIPTHTPIVIDGRLSEDAWRKAPPIEHFVDYRILRLARFETRARLAYDANALYIAFECFDTNPKGITATLPQRDEYALCDSVEVFIAPRMHSKEFVHWVIDSKGTIFDARAVRMPDGVVKYSSRWNGTAKAKVIRGADRWTVEMAIPASDLGFAPKAGMVCRALLCRNIVHTKPKGEEECTAIVFLDGSSFHTVDKFARLRFASSDEPLPSPQVELVLRPLNFSHETMGDGVGTLISGGLRVDTDRNLHDFRITVECTDGIALLSKRELGKASLVRLMWRPKEPFSILFPAQLSGVVCKFIVTSREGMWTFTRRFGHPRRAPIPREKLFTNGVDGLALAMPAFFSSVNPKTIQLSEGTIEFWVRPRWDVITRYVGPRGALEHTFFNMGPIRPDYPHLSNRDSLTIYHSASGYLTCIISNSNYESRMVQASIRNWRKGEWHHVALQWKLDDGGRTAMALFIDGRLASNKCVGSKKHPNTKPLKVNQLPLPIQIGSMNTGYRIADADIDELRISSIRRYKGAFTVRRRFEPDAHTLALFHFDGTLSADVPSGVIAT